MPTVRILWSRLCCLALFALLATHLAAAQGTGYWHTHGSQIEDDQGRAVRIAGINWFGFETSEMVVHGLQNQGYRQILHLIKTSGFNTIRLPYSSQMVEHPIVPRLEKGEGKANSELAGLNAQQIMDRILAAAGDEGLKVILDNHRSEAGNSNQRSGLWYSAAYPEENWIADWQQLVARYSSYTDPNGNPTLIGVDLRNEPFRMVNGQPTGSCWTGDQNAGGCPITDAAHNWPAAAQRAATTILNANPKLLIFVEGVDCYSGKCNWQGGNLMGAGQFPVELPYSGHLVYSAHDYGPSVSPQPWFTPATTPASLQQHWSEQWAYLAQQNIAPVWLGEFGSGNKDSDLQSTLAGSQGQWFSTMIGFLRAQSSIHWSYWALNGEDPTGLLSQNYEAAQNSQKLDQLASIEFPLALTPASAPPAIATTPATDEAPPPSSKKTRLFLLIGGLALVMAALVLLQIRQQSKPDKPDQER